MNIEDSSRLRKLKKEEGETHVSGETYMKRLQEHYTTTTAAGDLFAWAKPQQVQQDAVESEDEDPITKLLKSNTKAFSRNTIGLLKPG